MFEPLESRALLAADLVISEFMARNSGGLLDAFGESSDWIEIHNPGVLPVDLDRWWLQDNNNVWGFPETKTLLPDERLIVFASGRDIVEINETTGQKEFHTNFRLGERDSLTLTGPDGISLPRFDDFPPQIANISYGVGRAADTTTLVAEGAVAEVLIPTESEFNTLGNLWRGGDEAVFQQLADAPEWTDGTGTGTGIGFGFPDVIDTDVQAEMQSVNASAWIRIPFDADGDDLDQFSQLTLRMQYDDGFIAYLNGTEIARESFAGPLEWDSKAVDDRPDFLARQWQTFDVSQYLGLLAPGENILAIHGLNDSRGGDNFLIIPELIGETAGENTSVGFMQIPTPGRPNTLSVIDFVAEPTIEVQESDGQGGWSVAETEDGFYRFQSDSRRFTAATTTVGAALYYTLDGSIPKPGNPTAQLYTDPVPISPSPDGAVFRSAAFQAGFGPSRTATQTVILIDKVRNQQQMDSEVVGVGGIENQFGGKYVAGIEDSLTSIPTLSLSLSEDQFFGPGGIHSNAGRRGRAWEQPVSLEYFDPAGGGREFQIDAGIRIDGSGDRGAAKKSFRLYFRSQYGDGKLNYRLFEDAAVDGFDRLLLRSPARDAWQSPFRDEAAAATYMRDEFVRRSLADMGQPVPNGRFIHLYINGQYWGVYDLTERPDAAFAEETFGGFKEDYDVIKDGAFPFSEVVAGDQQAWIDVLTWAEAGLEDPASYNYFSQIVNIDSLIDYMLVNFYVGTTDWLPNNWTAIANVNRDQENIITGFRFIPGDSESALADLDVNVTDVGAIDSPAFLFRQALANESFRQRFSDRIQRFFFGNGALTPASSATRWNAIADEIDQAMIAESARWGDEHSVVPYTPDEFWLPQVEWVEETFLPSRSDIVFDQLKQIDLYPDVQPVRFSSPGGGITGPLDLNLTTPEGDIWYTLDGSDPRQVDGQVAAEAILYTGPILVDRITQVRAAAFDGQGWSALSEAFFTSLLSELRLTEIMFNPDGGDSVEYLEFSNVSAFPLDLTGVSISEGVDFVFPDGFVLEPGAHTLVVRSISSFINRYTNQIPEIGSLIAGQYSGRLSNSSDLLKVELVSPFQQTLMEFAYDEDWYVETDGDGPSLVLVDPQLGVDELGNKESWRPSIAAGGSPGSADILHGDINLDGTAGLVDVGMFQVLYSPSGQIDVEDPRVAADFNHDRFIDRRDIGLLLRDYSKTSRYVADVFDPTPPPVPTDLQFVARSQSQIELTWTKEEPEQIDHWNIYRDGVRIATSDSASFSDFNVSADFSYSYQIAAVNARQIEGALSEPILVDLLDVESAFSANSTTIVVVFTDPVDQVTAENPGSYVVSGIEVQATELLAGGLQVVLTTEPLTLGQPYRVSVSGVATQNSIQTIVPGAESFFVHGGVVTDATLPTVADVAVSSGQWTSEFTLNVSQGSGAGYSIGPDSDTREVVSWDKIDRFSVTFGEDVAVRADHLRVLGLRQAEYAVRELIYDPATFTATWLLRDPILNDRIDVFVSGDIKDLAGNRVGVDIRVQTDVLAGDVDHSGTVDDNDLRVMLSKQFTALASADYLSVADLDGNGKVNLRDLFVGSRLQGATLPGSRMIISEVMALNQNTLQDEDGDSSDWIEIENADSATVDLAGWFLTDDPDQPTKWRFPETIVSPGQHVVVFASGKDRTSPGQTLHTNFSLNASDDFLALVQPDGVTVAWEYRSLTNQQADVSYGWSADSERERFFATPTPGEVNPVENTILITEFMADNDLGGLKDEDGDAADWIEILNSGATDEYLAGWYFVNDGTRWEFPPVNLAAGEYLVVFASANDRRDPESELHTNFRLASAGEDLSLVRPDLEIVSSFSPYPAQRADVSYGLTIDGASRRFFNDPTPGGPNLTGFDGVRFSTARGFYTEPINVELSTEAMGAEIRYTTNGDSPTLESSTLYDPNQPLEISVTTTLRAAAFTDGQPIEVSAQTYLFLDDVIRRQTDPVYLDSLPKTWAKGVDYDLNVGVSGLNIKEDLRSLPTVSLVLSQDDLFSDENGIYAFPNLEGPDWQRDGSLELFDLPAGEGEGFSASGKIRITGRMQTRISNDMVAQPKLSFAIDFDQPLVLGETTTQLFSNSRAGQFAGLTLRAGYEDSWLSVDGDQRGRAQYIRDQWVRDTQRAMGHEAIDGRFVQLYVNGLYWGVYNLTETPGADFASQALGGNATDYEVIEGSREGARVVAGDASAEAWTSMVDRLNADLSIAENYAVVQQLLDIESLIDFLILDVYSYAGNTTDPVKIKDPNRGWFAVRDAAQDGPFQLFAWDNEAVLGIADEDWLGTDRQELAPGGGNAEAQTPTFDPYKALDSLSDNEDFRQQFADRVYEHTSGGGPLSEQAASKRYGQLTDQAERALYTESARWGGYRRRIDPVDPDESEGIPEYEVPDHIQPERDRLDDEFFPERWILALGFFQDAGLYPQVDVPIFGGNINGQSGIGRGGTVSAGFELSMSSSGEAIYYTLDGSDPREEGGGVSPSASIYTVPIILQQNVDVLTRTRDGGQWSALNNARFVMVEPPPLRITEMMFHPDDPPEGSGYEDDDFEFIELKNVGDDSVSLAGMKFIEGIDFAFDDGDITTLAPNEYLVIVKNREAFLTRYQIGAEKIAGQYEGRLNNGGDDLRVVDAFGHNVLRTSYQDDWISVTDGEGFSLTATDEQNLPSSLTTPQLWRGLWQASLFSGGSPGEAESLLPQGAVVINEVLAASDATDSQSVGDWIELRNTTDEAIDIGNWFLSDTANELDKFSIPALTIISPGGYVVFDQKNDGLFGLKRDGDEVLLSSGDASGLIGGYRRQLSFGSAAETGISFGRYARSNGEIAFVAMEIATPNAANGLPEVGPVVINEVMFSPLPTDDGSDAEGAEYVELFNLSDTAVDLGDWQLDTGVDFRFPEGTILSPGGYVVIASTNPAIFRDQYEVGAETLLLGPFAGKLNNGGERIDLLRPVTGRPDAMADRANYDNETPWPLLADGLGASLNRRIVNAFGDDSINWVASTLGGTPGKANESVDSAPRVFPYSQQTVGFGFETGSMFELPGWTLSVSVPADVVRTIDNDVLWEVTGDDNPVAGSFGLRAAANVAGPTTQTAVLALDLSGQAGRTDLALDFYLRLDGLINGATLEASGDGNSWQTIGPQIDSPQAQAVHYALDLDRALADAGIVLDSDVYVRFVHHTQRVGDVMTLDDVRISDVDLFGPSVVLQSPDTTISGPWDQIEITFDEAINGTTFGSDDVTLRGPLGDQIGNPIVTTIEATSDPLIWLVRFGTQQIAGTYFFELGPNIEDLQGNPMSPDGLLVGGVGIGDGRYSAQIELVAQSAQPFPYRLSGTNTGEGWSFSSRDGGTWSIETVGNLTSTSGPSPGQASVQDATLRVDLSGRGDVENVSLDFSVTREGNSDNNAGELFASADGIVWRRLFGLTPPIGVKTEYQFNLDLELSKVGIPTDAEVYLRFSHTANAADVFRLHDVRVDATDVQGPRVLGHWTLAGDDGAVTGIGLSFDKPVDPTTFSTSDLLITGPDGMPIVSQSVESADQFQWTILFSAQSLAGTYSVTVGPDVFDTSGNQMNQDADPIHGEIGEDSYVGSFQIDPQAVTQFPYRQDFEAGPIGSLGGWSFDVDDRGQWQRTSQGEPQAGGFHLQAVQTGEGQSVQEAVLVADLSDLDDPSSLNLDFWVRLDGSPGAPHRGRLFVSGDGQSWSWLSNLSPSDGQDKHFAFDLDEALADRGIAIDGDVYIKFRHEGELKNDTMFLDDVRLTDANVSGPRIVGQTPVTSNLGESQFEITFDRPIDPSTIGVEEITIFAGHFSNGEDVNLTPLTIATADNLTFTVTFTTPAVGGEYSLRVRSGRITDSLGIPLNQDGDILAGEPAASDGLGGDVYVGGFEVQTTAQSIPYSQDFDSGSYDSLVGWTLSVMGQSDYGEELWEFEPDTAAGGFSLLATQSWDCWTIHEATLALELSDAAGSLDLVLEFDLTFETQKEGLEERRSAQVFLSTNVAGSEVAITDVLVQLDSIRQPYMIPLSDFLAPMVSDPSFDGVIYFRFNRRGFHKRSAVGLDNVGIHPRVPVAGSAPPAAATVAKIAAAEPPDPQRSLTRPTPQPLAASRVRRSAAADQVFAGERFVSRELSSAILRTHRRSLAGPREVVLDEVIGLVLADRD